MLLDTEKYLKALFQLAISVAILFGAATYGFAQTQPRLINFQGKLTDQQGQVLDGTYTVIFSLYAMSTGGTALWTERHENLSISQGLVNALLGSIQSLDEPQKVEFDVPRYLGITIDVDNNAISPDPEMLPRQRIIPAIYAYNADYAHDAGYAQDADNLDGKDSSFFTNPQTDAGRQGVVEDLYEGDTKLSAKYVEQTDTVRIKTDIPSNPVVGDTYFDIPLKTLYLYGANEAGNWVAAGVPKGAVIMWSGSIESIPFGFRLCDGEEGTPDLRGKFIVGYHSEEVDYDAIGKTGGEKTHTLTVDEMPAHKHSSKIGNVYGYAENYGNNWITRVNGSHTTNSSGSNQPHENRSPYYTMAYICKL